MSDDRDQDLTRRKYRDAAAILPFAGAFLLMPPIIQIFGSGGDIAGIPIIIVYLIVVWFALIVCAWWLAGPLHEAMEIELRGSSDVDTPVA